MTAQARKASAIAVRDGRTSTSVRRLGGRRRERGPRRGERAGRDVVVEAEARHRRAAERGRTGTAREEGDGRLDDVAGRQAPRQVELTASRVDGPAAEALARQI